MIDDMSVGTALCPRLTRRDYDMLIGLSRESKLGSLYHQLLLDKLGTARIISLGEVTTDLATFGSIVRYRVGDSAPYEHKLLVGRRRNPSARCVSIETLRGLSLLGMRADDTVRIPLADVGSEVVTLEKVIYQPEWGGMFIYPEAV